MNQYCVYLLSRNDAVFSKINVVKLIYTIYNKLATNWQQKISKPQ